MDQTWQFPTVHCHMFPGNTSKLHFPARLTVRHKLGGGIKGHFHALSPLWLPGVEMTLWATFEAKC